MTTVLADTIAQIRQAVTDLNPPRFGTVVSDVSFLHEADGSWRATVTVQGAKKTSQVRDGIVLVDPGSTLVFTGAGRHPEQAAIDLLATVRRSWQSSSSAADVRGAA
jgi:hypothetical protein